MTQRRPLYLFGGATPAEAATGDTLLPSVLASGAAGATTVLAGDGSWQTVPTVLGYTPVNAAGAVTSVAGRTGAVVFAAADVTTALGYTPVQQGTGIGQAANLVAIGWSASGLKATVDAADEGFFVMTTNPQGFVKTGDSPSFAGLSATTLAVTGASTLAGVTASQLTVTGPTNLATTSATYLTVAGDIVSNRSDGSGAVFFGPSGTKFIYMDGTNFNLSGAGLWVSNATIAGALQTNSINSSGSITGSCTGSVWQNPQNFALAAASWDGTCATLSLVRHGYYGINLSLDGANNVILGGWSQGSTATSYRVYWDTAGNQITGGTITAPSLTINGQASITGTLYSGLIRISPANNTGIAYFGTGDTYLYYDGTNFTIQGGYLAAPGGVVTPSLTVNGSASITTNLLVSQTGTFGALTSGAIISGAITSNGAINAAGTIQGGALTARLITATGTAPLALQNFDGSKLYMTFVRQGYYGINLGLDVSNNFYLGDFSQGAGVARVYWDPAGNQTTLGKVTATAFSTVGATTTNTLYAAGIACTGNTTTNTLNVAGTLSAGDMYTSRGDATGVIFFGNTLEFIYYANSVFNFTKGCIISGDVTITGNLTVNGNIYKS